jgi:hypothetical protein
VKPAPTHPAEYTLNYLTALDAAAQPPGWSAHVTSETGKWGVIWARDKPTSEREVMGVGDLADVNLMVAARNALPALLEVAAAGLALLDVSHIDRPSQDDLRKMDHAWRGLAVGMAHLAGCRHLSES